MRKLLLAALAITALQAQEVVFTQTGYRWIRRAVLVPWSDFNLGTATTLTTDFLRSQPEDDLVQFLVVTERWQAEQTAKPRPRLGGLAKLNWTMAEADAWRISVFDEWLRVRGSYMNLDWTMAETTAFGGNAVMRFRMGNQRATRHVLRGADPLLFQVNGKPYEVLQIFLYAYAFGRSFPPKVLVRAPSKVEAADAEGVVKRLVEVLRWEEVMGMSVLFRADAWLPFDVDFPYYCPLCEDDRLPTKQEYFSASWSICLSSRGKILCPP